MAQKGRETLAAIGNKTTQAVSYVADRAPGLIGALIIGGAVSTIANPSVVQEDAVVATVATVAAAASLVLSSNVRNGVCQVASGVASLTKGACTVVANLPGQAKQAAVYGQRQLSRCWRTTKTNASECCTKTQRAKASAQAALSRCGRYTKTKVQRAAISGQVAVSRCWQGTKRHASTAGQVCGELRQHTVETVEPYIQSVHEHLVAPVTEYLRDNLITRNPAAPAAPRGSVLPSCRAVGNLVKNGFLVGAKGVIATGKAVVKCVSKVGQVSAMALEAANERAPALVGAVATAALTYATYQAAQMIPSFPEPTAPVQDVSPLGDLPSNSFHLPPNF